MAIQYTAGLYLNPTPHKIRTPTDCPQAASIPIYIPSAPCMKLLFSVTSPNVAFLFASRYFRQKTVGVKSSNVDIPSESHDTAFLQHYNN